MTDTTAETGLRALRSDPDIRMEATPQRATASRCPVAKLLRVLPLSMEGRSHAATAATAQLLEEAGGLPALRRFTALFYRRVFEDPHVDRFIRDREDPHGERFATWVAQKLGEPSAPWDADRASRPQCPVPTARGPMLVHDRTSAHAAAWFSLKREEHKVGQRFNLEDCRVWMRLHFWAARESGLLGHRGFADYYVRFIGHFIRVYEASAPPFTREALRWSADPKNLEAYRAAGNAMPDVAVPLRAALKTLPPEEREGPWPYA